MLLEKARNKMWFQDYYYLQDSHVREERKDKEPVCRENVIVIESVPVINVMVLEWREFSTKLHQGMSAPSI